MQIWVGTFNLNGRGSGVKEDLAAWLRPDIDRLQQYPGIVAVGFQEIVELSPQQIMSTDPVRRQAWETAVRRTLNDSAPKHPSEEYILLRSGQLVGAALMIFVKASILHNIKNVEGSVKKVRFEKSLALGDAELTIERPACLGWRETKAPWPYGWTMQTPASASSQPTWLLALLIMKNATATIVRSAMASASNEIDPLKTMMQSYGWEISTTE